MSSRTRPRSASPPYRSSADHARSTLPAKRAHLAVGGRCRQGEDRLAVNGGPAADVMVSYLDSSAYRACQFSRPAGRERLPRFR